MKKSLLYLSIFFFIFSSCNKNDDDNNQNSNSNIPRAVFDTGGLINTNLPQFSQLRFAGNFIVLNNNNYGINGIVVFYSGGENYSAFELTDPNHMINSCSKLSVDNAIASCTCEDGNSYELSNGLPLEGTSGQFPLTRYFVEANGNIIRVFNN